MTKEEIRQKAVDNADKRIKEVDKNTLSAIADYDRGLIQGFEDGAECMQERMIEKAAEWFEKYLFDIGYPDDWCRDSLSLISGKDRFIKAMRDESK